MLSRVCVGRLMKIFIAILIVTLLLAIYEIIFILIQLLSSHTSASGPDKYGAGTVTKIMAIDLDGLIDHVIGLYTLGVVVFILRYRSYKLQQSRKRVPQFFAGTAILKKQHAITQENWKDKIQGVWQQFKAEGLDEFAALTEPSAVRRTLGAIAFFKVRHTITIENGYFLLQRDLGISVSVWNLKALIGSSKETSQRVSVPVESGGNYLFRVWIDEEKKELYMESAPAEGFEGVTTIQTRSLIDNDLMKMVSILSPHFHSTILLLSLLVLALGREESRRSNW